MSAVELYKSCLRGSILVFWEKVFFLANKSSLQSTCMYFRDYNLKQYFVDVSSLIWEWQNCLKIILLSNQSLSLRKLALFLSIKLAIATAFYKDSVMFDVLVCMVDLANGVDS